MKSYYKGPIGNQRSFERYHPRPPSVSPFQDWGFATPTQNCNRYYLRNGVQIWQIHSQCEFTVSAKFEFHRVHPNRPYKPIKNFGEKGAWANPFHGLPEFFEYPWLSQEQVKLRTSNLAGTFTGSLRTKTH